MSVSRLTKTGLFKKLPPPTEDTRVELLLHRAVLDKALLDLFTEEEDHRHDAKHWLDLDNPNFVEICEIAFLDPELVFKLFLMVKRIFIEKGEDIYFDEDKNYKFHNTKEIL